MVPCHGGLFPDSCGDGPGAGLETHLPRPFTLRVLSTLHADLSVPLGQAQGWGSSLAYRGLEAPCLWTQSNPQSAQTGEAAVGALAWLQGRASSAQPGKCTQPSSTAG
jgi:hypothetical protein